jgi:hypothetical protein
MEQRIAALVHSGFRAYDLEPSGIEQIGKVPAHPLFG